MIYYRSSFVIRSFLATQDMISRIELTNFMSHRHTVIEPAAGLTVLVGPNNVGKSAIVAALQILCHNEPSSYVLRHGERECSVKVQTDDGHLVEWRRKTSPSYVIDGQAFDRLGRSGVPDELQQALRLPRVDSECDADFDVHFGTQKSPVFLLNSSAANAARFFASSSDAIRLVAMQKRHKDKLSEAQREKNGLEKQSKEVNAQLELLEPVADIDHRLKMAEHAYGELVQSEDWLRDAEENETALRAQEAELTQRKAHAAALSSLSPPPVLVPTQSLELLVEAIQSEDGEYQRANSQAAALKTLGAAPALAVTEPLAALINSLELVESSRILASSQGGALALLALAPPMHDTASLARLSQKLNAICESAQQVEEERRSLGRLSTPPQLTDVDALQSLSNRLAVSERKLEAAQQRSAVLEVAAPPPGQGDEAALTALLEKVAQTVIQHVRWKQALATLETALAPPLAADISGLAESIVRLELLADEVVVQRTELKASQVKLERAGDELRSRADGELCPICGSPLDPDAVVERAALGMGGHKHA